MSEQIEAPMEPPEHEESFFVSHIGTVSVNNYGTVEWETRGAPAYGIEPQKVIMHIRTLYEITRETKKRVALMRKAGIYV